MINFHTSLHAKVLLIISGVFVGIIASYIVITKQVLYPEYIQLEQEEALKYLSRCSQSIENELNNLRILCADWSSWTDTYTYVQNPGKDYEESNLIDQTFTTYGLQLIYILNQNNDKVWGKIFSPDFKTQIELAGFQKEGFPDDHPLLQFEHQDDLMKMTRAGIWSSEHGPMLIVSNPILTSDTQGPINGTFIMGKFLTDNYIEKLGMQLESKFKLILPDTADNPLEFKTLEEKTRNNNGHYMKAEPDQVFIYRQFLDIESKTAFIIEVPFERNITKSAIKNLGFALGVFIILTLVVLFILNFLFRKSIIKPIVLLTQFTSDIKQNKKFDQRVSIERGDEIGTLGKQMNEMVGTIDEQTTALTETNQKLQKSLDEIKTLRGIIPICAKCKKIRDDEGYWEVLETYIEQFSDASFTHSICPECSDELYGKERWYAKMNKKTPE